MSATSGTMRVTLSVEIDVGPWGGDATFDSLHEQASREAKQKLQQLTQKDYCIRHIEILEVGAIIIKRVK